MNQSIICQCITQLAGYQEPEISQSEFSNKPLTSSVIFFIIEKAFDVSLSLISLYGVLSSQ